MGFGSSPYGSMEFGGGGPVVLDLSDHPGLARISPIPASAISPFTPVVFEVVDADPGLAVVVGWVKYKARRGRIVFYADGQLQPGFLQASTVATACSPNNLGFSIVPDYGWAGEIEELTIRAADGNDLTLVAYGFTDSPCP